MSSKQYNNKNFLELMKEFAKKFVAEAKNLQGKYENMYKSRSSLERLASRVLYSEPILKENILEEMQKDDSLKGIRNMGRGVNTRKSQTLQMYLSMLAADENFYGNNTGSEDIITGILMAAVDQAILTEGRMDEQLVASNIATTYGKLIKFLKSEQIEEDYLVGFFGFEVDDDVRINFGEAVALVFNETQSRYFFNDDEIKFVLKMKIPVKYNESRETKFDKLEGAKRVAHNAQLSLILSLSKDGKPFYAYIERDRLVRADGTITSMTVNDKYVLSKKSSQKITSDMVNKIAIKYLTIVDRGDMPGLKHAIGRMLSAVCRRIDPGDMLLDAVMCWEILMGLNEQNGATFRVCASSAALLTRYGCGNKKDIFNEMKNIYNSRSDLVHGNIGKYKPDINKTNKAICYAVQLINAIIEDEILLNKSSEGRNEFMLLEC